MEECLKHNRNRYEKNAYKRYVHKLNKIYLWINSFEQQCILPYSFLNQGKNSAHCSLIVQKYDDFNFQCTSNAMHLFSETVSPKNHGQVCLYIKGYKDKLLVSFTATTPSITTATHTGEKYLLYHQSWERFLPESYSHHFVFHTGEFLMS